MSKKYQETGTWLMFLSAIRLLDPDMLIWLGETQDTEQKLWELCEIVDARPILNGEDTSLITSLKKQLSSLLGSEFFHRLIFWNFLEIKKLL